jgi:DNA-binding response OmpR family regulator
MYTLLIEDDPDYADLIKHTLERAGHDVVYFERIEPAVRFADRKSPRLAVLDVMLPDGTGFDACRHLRHSTPDLPVVFLSSLDRNSDIVAGLESGGDDYVVKPFHPRELQARVNALLRRQEHGHAADRPTDAIRAGELAIATAESRVFYGKQEVLCTATEIAILAALAEHQGQPLSHAFLTEQVWGYGAVNDATLLKGHLSSIRRKLRDAGAPDRLIATLHGVGYVLQPGVN